MGNNISRSERMKKLITYLIIILSLLILYGCDVPTDVTIPVYLTNSADSTYNIWIGHASEVLPINDVAPGGSIPYSVTLKGMGKQDDPNRFDDKITVNVAKDGTKISTEKISVTGPIKESLILNWNGSSFSLQ
jgi:hypothetical protein